MGERRQVLVTLTFEPDLIPGFSDKVAALEAQGFEVRVHPARRVLSEAELVGALDGVYAYVASGEQVTRRVFERSPALRILSRMGAGYDSVDVAAASEHGVLVSVTPGANAQAVAEYALALLLALMRGVAETDRRVRAGGWGPRFGTALPGKTLGVVGLGQVGKELVRLSSGFGLRVLAHDPRPDEDFAARHGVSCVPLDELLGASDCISLHLPRTPATENLIADEAFARMKPGVFVVNCARGGVVNEAALCRALASGRVAGAALDVFEREPPGGDSPLLGMDGVLLSSHTAGMTYECRGRVVEAAFQNVADLARGLSPAGLVNPEVL